MKNYAVRSKALKSRKKRQTWGQQEEENGRRIKKEIHQREKYRRQQHPQQDYKQEIEQLQQENFQKSKKSQRKHQRYQRKLEKEKIKDLETIDASWRAVLLQKFDTVYHSIARKITCTYGYCPTLNKTA